MNRYSVKIDYSYVETCYEYYVVEAETRSKAIYKCYKEYFFTDKVYGLSFREYLTHFFRNCKRCND